MPKKIDSARKDLTRALKKHASIVGSSAVSLKKAQRAAAAVHVAAFEYAALVEAKTGLSSPFGDVLQPGLDTSTMKSLTAERDAMASKPKKK